MLTLSPFSNARFSELLPSHSQEPFLCPPLITFYYLSFHILICILKETHLNSCPTIPFTMFSHPPSITLSSPSFISLSFHIFLLSALHERDSFSTNLFHKLSNLHINFLHCGGRILPFQSYTSSQMFLSCLYS